MILKWIFVFKILDQSFRRARKLNTNNIYSPPKTFDHLEMNEPEYFQEMCRLATSRLDLGQRFFEFYNISQLHDQFERCGGENSTWVNPVIDVIGYLVNRRRKQLRSDLLESIYPSFFSEIAYIKERLNP